MQQISFAYSAFHFLQFAGQGGLNLSNEDSVLNLPTLKNWTEGRKRGDYQLVTAQDFFRYAMVSIRESTTQINTQEFLKFKKILD